MNSRPNGTRVLRIGATSQVAGQCRTGNIAENRASLPKAFQMPSLRPDVSTRAIDRAFALLADVRIDSMRSRFVSGILFSSLSRFPSLPRVLVNLGQCIIGLRLRRARPFPFRLRLGLFLIHAEDTWRAVRKGEHQRLGAIRSLGAALPSFVF